ncbi:hypothetical protein FJY68_02460 [candidate division WOR-3 bacterium]|uniref:PIN-like domain-containing protein n=1 Tax=candidate division WOR-3 bacterium TaxID=2052148 RepID=A0A937XFK5_UNCW3|nr:hypothetical protein [candidate division WOR-3 bacterium]
MVATADKPRLLLVDFENVQQVELARLDDSYRVIIFVGADQKSVPFDLVTRAQQLGSRVEWQKITGNGSNALDFFIAFQLGRVFDKSPRPECTILSRDKGFDPLVRFLNSGAMKCRRITSLGELHHKAVTAAPSVPAAEEPKLKRVVEVLGNLEKRGRPRKRKTLSQAISAMFQKRIPTQEVERIIATMLARRLITEAHNAITYEF